MQLETKIVTVIFDSLSLEELEAMVVEKKAKLKTLPIKLTEKQITKNYCMDYLKKKLHAPKYK